MQARNSSVALRGSHLHSSGKYGAVLHRATLHSAMSTLSANYLSGTAVSVCRGSHARMCASDVAGAAVGVHCAGGAVDVSQSSIRARRHAVLGRNAALDIRGDCSLQAEEDVTVVAEPGCTLQLSDCTVSAGGFAAVAVLCSRIEAMHNELSCHWGPRTAPIVLNRISPGSKLVDNTVVCDPEPEHTAWFVFASQEDLRAVEVETPLLQHPRLAQCDVPRQHCVAHSPACMLQSSPEHVSTVVWLRAHGAHEWTAAERVMAILADVAGTFAVLLDWLMKRDPREILRMVACIPKGLVSGVRAQLVRPPLSTTCAMHCPYDPLPRARPPCSVACARTPPPPPSRRMPNRGVRSVRNARRPACSAH